MQLDGHHTATYVAARAAGFLHDEALIVAYSAQYVDDATNSGIIQFVDSEYMYSRIASAHKTVDHHNLMDFDNHNVWLPFHFLPSNSCAKKGEESETEISKIVCEEDSDVARDMLRAALTDRNTPRGLYRLGVAMHVYADTFTHHGFIGALNEANRVSGITCGNKKMDNEILCSTLSDLALEIASNFWAFLKMIYYSLKFMIKERKSFLIYYRTFYSKEPLGHARASVFPDQPFLKWEYVNWKGQKVIRNNPEIFSRAINMMTKAMRAWRANDVTMMLEQYDGLNQNDNDLVYKIITDNNNPDAIIRHRAWINNLAQGNFSFGPVSLAYISKGRGSWKYEALDTTKAKDSGYEMYQFDPSFMDSKWKLFHDALQLHRVAIIYDVLPKYKICIS